MSFHPNPYVKQPSNPTTSNQTKASNPLIPFLQTRVPYTMCPICGTDPIKCQE